MSKADELFEEMNFKKIKDTEVEVIYEDKEYFMGDNCTHTILFAKVGKIVFSYSKERHETMGIGMKELKTINLKCHELRLDRRRR